MQDDIAFETHEDHALRLDAERWRWLRQCQGWPESGAAMIGATPEDFDKLADQGRAAAIQNYGGSD